MNETSDFCKLHDIAENMERVLALTEGLPVTGELVAARLLVKEASFYLSRLAYQMDENLAELDAPADAAGVF